MRHLKNKLAKARAKAVPDHQIKEEEEGQLEPNSDSREGDQTIDVKVEEGSDASEESDLENMLSSEQEFSKASTGKKSDRGSTSAKNIVKNYGRALANFAASNLASPYLISLLEREKVKLKDFRRFISSKKKRARCIAGLRNLLVVQGEDGENTACFKRIFKDISIIFLKYFSVNWIYSGKLCDKLTHLKYRFKILRRVKNPEHFTYLKGFT